MMRELTMVSESNIETCVGPFLTLFTINLNFHRFLYYFRKPYSYKMTHSPVDFKRFVCTAMNDVRQLLHNQSFWSWGWSFMHIALLFWKTEKQKKSNKSNNKIRNEINETNHFCYICKLLSRWLLQWNSYRKINYISSALKQNLELPKVSMKWVSSSSSTSWSLVWANSDGRHELIEWLILLLIPLWVLFLYYK